MQKFLIIILVLISSQYRLAALNAVPDSLMLRLDLEINDSIKANILYDLGEHYHLNNPDTAIFFLKNSIVISKTKNYQEVLGLPYRQAVNQKRFLFPCKQPGHSHPDKCANAPAQQGRPGKPYD